MPQTVVELLRNAAEKYCDKAYVSEKTDSGYLAKTFATVYRESHYCARYLLWAGFVKNDKIALLSEGRNSWVVAEFGCIFAGIIAVPLSIKLIPEEILFRIRHSEARALFISKNLISMLEPILDKILLLGLTLFYFDDDPSELKTMCSRHDRGNEPFIVSFQTVIQRGKEMFEADSDPVDQAIESIQEDDIVTISYTSGTTGNPKGIMLTHRNYWNNSTDAINFFEMPYFYKILIILPIDHSFAHTIGMFAACTRALSVSFVDSREGLKNALKNISSNINEVNPNFMITVPALSRNFMNKIIDGVRGRGKVFERLFNLGLQTGERVIEGKNDTDPWYSFIVNKTVYTFVDRLVFRSIRKKFGNDLKFFISGGALLDIGQQRFFNLIGIPVYQGYGLTEAAPIISTNTPKLHQIGSSGNVLPSIECRIVNERGHDAPKGSKGEIIIRGPNVMKGYLKNAVATRESIREGWLYTGDLGYLDERGFLHVIGREKALLISSDGEKYSPEEIEEAIVNCSHLIAQVLVYNDHKKFTSALVTLDQERVRQHIERFRISDSQQLLSEIKKSFYNFRQTKEYANKFPDKWIPSTFRLLHEPFSENNKMLNSSMKMVRQRIIEAHSTTIETVYTKDGTDVAVPHNIKIADTLIRKNN